MAKTTAPPPDWSDPRKSSIDDLSPSQVLALARDVLFDELKEAQARRELLAALPPYENLKTAWLDGFASPKTQQTWKESLAKLEAWCGLKSLSPLALTPGLADEFMTDLRLGTLRPTSVATAARGASSFFSWLADSYELDNPFLETRALPRTLVDPPHFPTDAELGRILAAAPAKDAAAVGILSGAGVSVTALPGLKLVAGVMTTIERGAAVSQPVPAMARDFLKKAELTGEYPFSFHTVKGWKERVKKLCDRLYRAGTISHGYSASDFRDYFVAKHWRENHDIVRLARLLGHKSVRTTRAYLARLGFQERD